MQEMLLLISSLYPVYPLHPCESLEMTMAEMTSHERFKRMWEYYLLSCAGAFRARDNQLWQIVLTKYGTPQPDCRC